MKKIITFLLSLTFTMFIGTAVHADELSKSESTSLATNYLVEILNPETGEKKQISLNKENVKINISEISPIEARTYGVITPISSDEKVFTQSVEIELGKELAQAFGLPSPRTSGSSTQDDNVKVSAGLTYSTNSSNNTVKISNAFGSTVNKGFYYVSKRAFYWRNPGSGKGSPLNPSSSSWNYSVSDNWGTYFSQLKPYAITDATVAISGMTGTRVVSVTYYLSA